MTIKRGEPVIVGYNDVYVAFDGTEFKSYWECDNYEESKLIELAEKTIEHKCAGWIPPDGCEHMDEHSYYWFKPKTEEDIKLLNKLWNCLNRIDRKIDDELEVEFFNSDIGDWVCIESNDGGDAWVSSVTCCINYITSLLTDFGYDVKIEPKKEDNNG